jgi:hypothetical protein
MERNFAVACGAVANDLPHGLRLIFRPRNALFALVERAAAA